MNLSENSAKIISKFLANTKKYINVLKIAKNYLGENGGMALASGIEKSKSLIHLDIASNGILRKGAENIFKAIGKNQSLICLNLGNLNGANRNNMFSLKSLCELNESLKKNFTLTFLDLKGTCIGNNGLKCIVNGIKMSRSLKYLNVSSNEITHISSYILYDLICESSLDKIDLSNNNLGNQFIKEAPKNKYFSQSSITHLNLSGCGLEGNGFVKFFGELRKMRFLSVLEIDEISIKPDEHNSVYNMLSANKILKKLYMSKSNLSSNILTELGKGLYENNTLEELYLSENKFESEGIRSLSLKILENDKCALKILDLSKNRFDVFFYDFFTKI